MIHQYQLLSNFLNFDHTPILSVSTDSSIMSQGGVAAGVILALTVFLFALKNFLKTLLESIAELIDKFDK